MNMLLKSHSRFTQRKFVDSCFDPRARMSTKADGLELRNTRSALCQISIKRIS
jgi:hypothetical protein